MGQLLSRDDCLSVRSFFSFSFSIQQENTQEERSRIGLGVGKEAVFFLWSVKRLDSRSLLLTFPHLKTDYCRRTMLIHPNSPFPASV